MDDFCSRNGILAWFRTSAKENFGIEEAYRCLISGILEQHETKAREPASEPEQSWFSDLFGFSNWFRGSDSRNGPQTPSNISQESSVVQISRESDSTSLLSVNESSPAKRTKKLHTLVMPPNAEYFPLLVALSLEQSGLQNFPEGVFNMPNLRTLILSRNSISELPGRMGKYCFVLLFQAHSTFKSLSLSFPCRRFAKFDYSGPFSQQTH